MQSSACALRETSVQLACVTVSISCFVRAYQRDLYVVYAERHRTGQMRHGDLKIFIMMHKKLKQKYFPLKNEERSQNL